MSTIEITRMEGGASVRFPYELKNSFRDCFKSAKWNPTARQWTVGPRSVKRLDARAEEVRASGILEELASRDDQDLASKERDRLRAELQEEMRRLGQARGDLGALETLRAEADTLRQELEARRVELNVLAQAKAKMDAELATDQARIDARVAEIVDLDGLNAALHGMRAIRSYTAKGRAAHEAGVAVVRAFLRQLTEVGITSNKLREIVHSNFNRVDRDGQPWRDAYSFRAMTAEEQESG